MRREFERAVQPAPQGWESPVDRRSSITQGEGPLICDLANIQVLPPVHPGVWQLGIGMEPRLRQALSGDGSRVSDDSDTRTAGIPDSNKMVFLGESDIVNKSTGRATRDTLECDYL